MNKYQEALDNMIYYSQDTTDLTEEECFRLLQELVDRATPKKVKVVPGDRLRFDGLCPNCNRPLFDGSDMFFKEKRYQFCDYCGQALDWSESTAKSTHNELDNIFTDSLETLERLKIKK